MLFTSSCLCLEVTDFLCVDLDTSLTLCCLPHTYSHLKPSTFCLQHYYSRRNSFPACSRSLLIIYDTQIPPKLHLCGLSAFLPEQNGEILTKPTGVIHRPDWLVGTVNSSQRDLSRSALSSLTTSSTNQTSPVPQR